MIPHHIVTAVTVLAVDLGHSIDRPLPNPVGAALFTGRICEGRVTFHLDRRILAPSEGASRLLHWLDARLHDEHATITGYDLAASAALLSGVPDADWSPALRILSDCGHRALLDTKIRCPDGRVLFAQACCAAGIPCTAPDPDGLFTAWMMERRALLAARLETDVIACWRLAMTRIAARSALGRRVDTAIGKHLAEWLRLSPSPAAALHLESLVPNRD